MNPALMVPIIAASQQQQYTQALRKAGATRAARAKTLAEIGCKPSRMLDGLIRQGLVVEPEPTRYYLNLDAVEARAERVRLGLLIAVVALAGILTLALLFSQLFAS